jgi:23S rRNA (cytosine1962-C5)-methyltransferase
MLELGHPWVIADRYTRQWPSGRAGDLVDLTDERGSFLAAALLDPAERVVARVLDRRPMHLDASWLQARVEQAAALRADHADLGETTAYRLINGEGDGLPGITVDRYEDHLLIQMYCAAWKPHLPMLAEILRQVFHPIGIYEKFRPQDTRKIGAGGVKKFSRLVAGKPLTGKFPVREGGLRFLVDLDEGLHTGLFLDHRRNRHDLARRCGGKRVLNLFAYTGAFSVAAGAGGAAQVTSVDVSPHYLAWAKDNVAANHLDPARQEFIVGDCFAVAADLKRQGRTFDLVFMDPPSFSTTAKSRFTTVRGTSEMVAATLPLLSPGGVLVTSSNHQKIDLAEYLKELRRGALQGGNELRIIHVGGQPEDFPYPVTFPEGRYLKYVVSVKN